MHLLFETRGKRQSVPSWPAPAKPALAGEFQSFRRLQAGAAIACLLLSTVPQSAVAQQTGELAPHRSDECAEERWSTFIRPRGTFVCPGLLEEPLRALYADHGRARYDR